MSRVVMISPAALGARMAGPAVRFVEMARVLARAGHTVSLVSPEPVPDSWTARPDGVETVHGTRSNLPGLAASAEVIVIQGLALRRYPFLKRSPAALVVDLYDPVFLETLSQSRSDIEPRSFHNFHLAQIQETIARGDFFICASDRQRDLWLGFLAAANRINPATFGHDPTLRRLIDLVPFGLADEPPSLKGPGLRGLPGIKADDRVILWNGGVWDWMSPEPLVEAMALLGQDLADVKLVFMGVRHPDPGIPDSAALGRVRDIIDRRDLARRVILNDWVAYEDRADFLLQADLGVCLYPPGPETDYSFRTRLLDCFWAGLPVLCSPGDALGGLAEAHGAGAVVNGLEAGEVAAAVRTLLIDPGRLSHMARRSARLAGRFHWPRAAASLERFCAAPSRAADRDQGYPSRPSRRLPPGYYISRLTAHLKSGTLLSALTAPIRARRGR